MNNIISDSLKLGYGISGLVRDGLLKANLKGLVQLSRPNWPASAHSRALDYLGGRQLRNATQFGSIAEYMDYLDDELQQFSKHKPVRTEMRVADEMQIARWEARWARLRTRVCLPGQEATQPKVGMVFPVKQAA